MLYLNKSRFSVPDVALNNKHLAVDTLFLASVLTKRNKMSTKNIGYSLDLYFLVFPIEIQKSISGFVKWSHVSIWKWVQKYKPERISYRRRKVSGFIIDETQIKVANGYFWLCVIMELNNKSFLIFNFSRKI